MLKPPRAKSQKEKCDSFETGGPNVLEARLLDNFPIGDDSPSNANHTIATHSCRALANGTAESTSLEKRTTNEILLPWLVAAFLTPAFGIVGFEQLSVPDPPSKVLSVAVWFPSVGKPVSVSIGPF